MRLSSQRADRAAGLAGAGQGLVHDALDGAGTTPALRAAAEAAIDLAGRPRTFGMTGRSDGAVGQDIAGADDHETWSSCPAL